MESLAVLVAIMFLADVFAGPVAIFLTWDKLVGVIASRTKSLAVVLTVIRRLLHGFLIAIGLFIGGWLTYIAVTPAKFFGIFSLVTSYIALRREYFPELFIVRDLLAQVGIKRKVEPPVFSSDGTEIIRTKKSWKNGRTLGGDSHGPEGQH
jgi:hypothetical protein